MKRKNHKGLALSAPSPKTPEPSAQDSQIPGGIGNNTTQLDTLEIGVEFQLDLKTDDLVVLRELGAGNGGTVSKVVHPATKIIMARKVYFPTSRNDQEPRANESRFVGDPCRGQRGSAEEHSEGTTYHEGLQFTEYCDLLRSVFERCWRRHHVYGVHGRWVSRRDGLWLSPAVTQCY